MSAKHTPGPWTYHRDEEQTVRDADGLAVAFFVSPTNARLIAAAPDLLEACKEFVRKCEVGAAHSTRSYAQMKAAIAKAEAAP